MQRSNAPSATRDHFARVRQLGLRLPGSVEGTSYGTPALRVGKRLLCRMKEDGTTLVLALGSLEEKELMLAEEPERFFETPHYAGYAMVLVRLTKISDKRLGALLTEGWQRLATARMKQALQDGPPAAAAKPQTKRKP